MNDYTRQPGNEIAETDLFGSDLDTKKEVLDIELRKTRTKLFTIAFVFFLFDLIALTRFGFVNARSILIISIIPVCMIGLAFLAMKEPLTAMILAAVIIAGLWIYHFIVFGSLTILAGWLGKAIIIYLVIAGFQNATEAKRIKKELTP